MENTVSRIKWVDSLKGIAMLGIVVIHAGGSALDGIWGKIGNAGHFGVQMFFLISAFLAWTSLGKGISYQTWIKKKLLRLLPLFYVAYTVALIVSLAMGGSFSAPSFIVHILGIWGLFPEYHNGLMAEWYLGALILFYIIAPGIHKFVNNIGRALVFFFLTVVFSESFNYIASSIFASKVADYNYLSYFGNTSLWYQFPTLAIGIILYYVIIGLGKLEVADSGCEVRLLSSVTMICIALILLAGIVMNKNYTWGFDIYICTTFAFGIIAASQYIFAVPIISNRVFMIIGKYSYPVYLFHYTLIRVINYYYKMGISTFFIKTVLSVVVPVLGTVIYECVVHLLIKRQET